MRSEKVNEVEARLDGNLVINVQIVIEQKFGRVVKVFVNGKENDFDEEDRNSKRMYLYDKGNGFGTLLEEYNY